MPILLLASVVLLTSCSNLIKLKYTDGRYIDTVNNVKYINAPISYEPVSVGTEYALFDKTTLYTLPGAEPTQWLAEKFEGIGSVFHSEEIELPGPGELEASEILIFISGYNNIPVSSISDPEVIAEFLYILENGEPVTAADTDSSYSLKLASDKYPFIYYNLIYIKGTDGGRYVYDRGTKLTVEIGPLIDDFFTGDNAINLPVGESEIIL
jgi:hypothetical protein